MMMSTLVSAGVGVVTATCTCAVLSAEPGRVVMPNLLLELDAIACRACDFCAGVVLAGSGVPGGVDLDLLREVKILCGAESGWRVRWVCAGAATLDVLSS